MSLSDRIIKLSDSKTLLMANKARDLKAKGIKVYDFTIGEPDFNTPDNMLKKYQINDPAELVKVYGLKHLEKQLKLKNL